MSLDYQGVCLRILVFFLYVKVSYGILRRRVQDSSRIFFV